MSLGMVPWVWWSLAWCKPSVQVRMATPRAATTQTPHPTGCLEGRRALSCATEIVCASNGKVAMIMLQHSNSHLCDHNLEPRSHSVWRWKVRSPFHLAVGDLGSRLVSSMRIWLQWMQIGGLSRCRCTCQHMSIYTPTMRWAINATAISYALYAAANGCASNVEIRSVINTNELNCVIQTKNSCTIRANTFVVLSTCTQSLEKSSNTHCIHTTDNR